MAGKTTRYEEIFTAGIDVRTRFLAPRLAADPSGGALIAGMFWYNITDNMYRGYNGSTVQDFGSGGLTTEQLQDLIAAMFDDTSTVDFTYNDGTGKLTAAVLDSPTVGGLSAAALQAAVIATIVDSAPGLLDTLNELAAAIGDDPNFAATITALIAAKPRTLDEAVSSGAATSVHTHNFNTRKLIAQVYVDSGSYEDEGLLVERTSVNTVTVRSEAGNIPAGRRILIIAVGT